MLSANICCADKVSVVYTVEHEWLHNLCFPVDDKTGYFSTDDYPAILYKTEDGAKTWKTYPLKFGSRNVYFPRNNMIGYLRGSDDYGQTISLTENGGITWTEIETNFKEISQEPNLSTFKISKLFFLNTQKGYALGAGTVLKTLDGGKTWVKQRPATSGLLHTISFPIDDKIGYVAGDKGIFKTSDSGEHWNLVYSTGVNSIHFPRTQAVGYGSYYGKIIKTVDGGKTWKDIANLDFVIQQIYFLKDEKTGYVIGGVTGEDNSWSMLMKTTDGGYKWDNIPLETTDDLNEITFPNDKIGFAIGRGGTVLKIIRDEHKPDDI